MHNNVTIPTWQKTSLVLIPVVLVIAGMGMNSWQARQHSIVERLQLKPAVSIKQAEYQVLTYPRFDDLNTIPSLSLEATQKSGQGSTLVSDTTQAPQNQTSPPSAESESAITPEQIKQAIASAKQHQSTRQSEGEDRTQQGDDALRHLDLSQLSPSIQSRVQAALKSETAAQQHGESLDAMDIRQHIDEFKGQLPPLNFQSHVYTTDVIRRWVKVNGVEYRQGDNLGPGIQLLDIKPQSTILKFQGKLIEIPALYDWKG